MPKALGSNATWMLGMSIVVLGACSSDSSPTQQQQQPPPPLPAITLSVSADSIILAPGDTAQLIATYARPAGVQGSLTVNIREWPMGVSVTTTGGAANSTEWTLIADTSATATFSNTVILVSGSGMTAAGDTVLVRVVPAP